MDLSTRNTYCSAYGGMASGVGLGFVALPGFGVVGRRKACIYVCAIAVLNGRRTEFSAEAVIGVVACAVHVQGQIGKGAIRHTEVVAGASAAESSIGIKHCGLVEGNPRGDVFGG